MNSFTRNNHGGKRPGAGRKRKVDEGAHAVRPALNGSKPVHIIVRLRDGLPGLRNNETLAAVRGFMQATQNFGLRINHFSLLKNHLHMIAEADGAEALQRGMMSLNGRLGRWLRKRGAYSAGYPRGLFKGRYHVRVIETARQMKNTLRYVLLNASKHFRKCPYIDAYSSGATFTGWATLLGERFRDLIESQVSSLQSRYGKRQIPLGEGLAPPMTWLGRIGWR